MPLDLSTEIAVRCRNRDPQLVSLLKEGGITTVLLQNPDQAFEAACRKAGLKVEALADIQFLPLDSVGHAAPNAGVALINGIWPGVSRGPRTNEDEFTAGASALPWVDANGYLYGMLRALYPDRPALLGYLPDEKAGVKPESLLPYDSLELALSEAWVNGGNYLLSLEPRYHARLLRGEAKAVKAWRRLGRTARWLPPALSLASGWPPRSLFPQLTSGCTLSSRVILKRFLSDARTSSTRLTKKPSVKRA